MKLYDLAGLAALGHHCVTVWRRVVPPVGTRWIPYSAAEVAARPAAQMVACVVCVAIPPAPAEAPPMPPIEITGPPLVLVPRRGDDPRFVSTPEPASALVLAVGLAALWVGRR